MVRSARKEAPYEFYHIVCEGHSEAYYIERLVQLLLKNKYFNISFKAYRPKWTKKGNTLTDPKHLIEQAKKIKKKEDFQHPDTMYILLDLDVFNSGIYNKQDFIKKCNMEGITPLFQKNNFEDFLVCHLDDESVKKWISIVTKYNFQMSDEEVVTEIKSIIPNYNKGSVPDNFLEKIFSIDSIMKLINLNKDIPFSSELIQLLKKIIKQS